MRILKIAKFYFDWVVYLGITLGDRNKYASAKLKGCRCEDIRHGMVTTTVKYDRARPPQERNYLTFGEFRQMWYPKEG